VCSVYLLMTALVSVPKRCVEDKYAQNNVVNRPLPEARNLRSPE